MTINQAEANRVGLTPDAGERRGRAARCSACRPAKFVSTIAQIARARARAGLGAIRPGAARRRSRSSVTDDHRRQYRSARWRPSSQRTRASELLRENQQQMIDDDGGCRARARSARS